MIREKNKERMPEGDSSIATSWDFILKFIIFFAWFKEAIVISDFFPFNLQLDIFFVFIQMVVITHYNHITESSRIFL